MARPVLSLSGLRVVIVEDHKMFREAVEFMLQQVLRCKVIGTADRAETAVALIQAERPDLVLLDLHLGGRDGFYVIEQVRAASCRARFIAVSARCDEYTQYRIEKVGECGFIDKNSQGVSLLGEAMEKTMAGGLFFSPAYLATRQKRLADPKSFTKILSDREIEVLELIAGSLSDEEIGARLHLSATTIQTHRSNIMRRLGLANTPKLIQYALACGFMHNPPAA